MITFSVFMMFFAALSVVNMSICYYTMRDYGGLKNNIAAIIVTETIMAIAAFGFAIMFMIAKFGANSVIM